MHPTTLHPLAARFPALRGPLARVLAAPGAPTWFPVACLAAGVLGAAVVLWLGPMGGAAAIAAICATIGLTWLAAGRDVTAMLTIAVWIAVLVPSRFVLGPFGANGWPPILLSVFFLVWWAAGRLTPSLGAARGINPVRYAVFGMLASLLLSYGSAFTNVLPPLQQTGGDRVAFLYAAYFGIALITCDGVGTLDRLMTLLRRLTWAIAYLGLTVLLQFRGLYDLAASPPPGLSANQPQFAEIRSGFTRSPGTAAHPIEASVVLGMGIVLALTFFFLAETKTERRRWMVATVLIGAALPMTVSRTGVLTLAVAMLILIPTWPSAWRRYAIVAGAVGVVLMRLAIPGLVGTIRGLFLSAGVDPSVAGRTQDYEPVLQIIYTHPWLGIGPGGFLPEIYFFLDNQILLTLLELGSVGLITLLVTPVVAAGAARAARRRTDDQRVRAVAQALAAAVFGGLASFITFDALSFPTFGLVWFLLIGACGALWRLVPAADAAASAAAASAAAASDAAVPPASAAVPAPTTVHGVTVP